LKSRTKQREIRKGKETTGQKLKELQQQKGGVGVKQREERLFSLEWTSHLGVR